MIERMSTPRFIVFDCETTGFGKHDRIVEIAALTLDPKTLEPTDEYDTLINPERDISNAGVHGITASMVGAAPTFSEVAATVARRLHGAILVAHNLSFDTRMLGQEFARVGVEFNGGAGFCTLKVTREKLNAACRRYGITLNHQHRALADARATASLAREVFVESDAELVSANLGYVRLPLNVRTLRRESSDAEISEMARIVSLSYFPCADEALLHYLDALDWVLDDGYIDDYERAAMKELASNLGITVEQCHQAHRSYLSSIIAAAERDGIVTESEKRLIENVANVLDITDVTLPNVTQLSASSHLQCGMRICFTGEVIVNGRKFERDLLQEKAAIVGMQPVRDVTKKGCDMLVAADISSQSGKARKARNYGIPVIEVTEFLNEVGIDIA